MKVEFASCLYIVVQTALDSTDIVEEFHVPVLVLSYSGLFIRSTLFAARTVFFLHDRKVMLAFCSILFRKISISRLNSLVVKSVYIRPISKPQLVQRTRARRAHAREYVQSLTCPLHHFFAFALGLRANASVAIPA